MKPSHKRFVFIAVVLVMGIIGLVLLSEDDAGGKSFLAAFIFLGAGAIAGKKWGKQVP